MHEEFLHYIWKHQLFHKNQLKTLDNELVEIIEVGTHNHNSGADFFNARLKIGNIIWAGDVEIHTQVSHWYLHQHHTDKAYNNVILHLVYELDNEQDTIQSNGYKVPIAVLNFDNRLFFRYNEFLENKLWIPCQKEWTKIDKSLFDTYLQELLVERLEQKAGLILFKLAQNQNHWEESFYQHLLRNFGLNINSEPFELLAKSLPLTCLGKHKDNLLQIEAMLFGQAGFLDDNCPDHYYQTLQKEYQFLKHKFQFQALEKHLWKFFGLQANNFATLRIAQFAQLIHRSSGLFARFMSEDNALSSHDLEQIFDLTASEYWNTHYVFGKTSSLRKKHFGTNAYKNIVINTFAPFLFAYGIAKGLDIYKERAIQLLKNCQAEKNSIIENWKALQLKVPNAYYSQALLQLNKKYCATRQCLNCRIAAPFFIT